MIVDVVPIKNRITPNFGLRFDFCYAPHVTYEECGLKFALHAQIYHWFLQLELLLSSPTIHVNILIINRS
jgi:hypothetical protein